MTNLIKQELEDGTAFSPQFSPDGLIPCVTTDHQTKDVLMVAYMNAESLKKTLDTGEAWYWSRSRQELWHKGATSGQIQKIIEMRTDCDQDCILISVDIQGDNKVACHTGKRSCFYRTVIKDKGGVLLNRQ